MPAPSKTDPPAGTTLPKLPDVPPIPVLPVIPIQAQPPAGISLPKIDPSRPTVLPTIPPTVPIPEIKPQVSAIKAAEKCATVMKGTLFDPKFVTFLRSPDTYEKLASNKTRTDYPLDRGQTSGGYFEHGYSQTDLKRAITLYNGTPEGKAHPVPDDGFHFDLGLHNMQRFETGGTPQHSHNGSLSIAALDRIAQIQDRADARAPNGKGTMINPKFAAWVDDNWDKDLKFGSDGDLDANRVKLCVDLWNAKHGDTHGHIEFTDADFSQLHNMSPINTANRSAANPVPRVRRQDLEYAVRAFYPDDRWRY